MTVARTTLLDLPIITTGTESGLWGDYTNNGLTQYLDISIAGMSNLTSANFTAGALTIETTEGTNSATNIVATSAQYAGFRVSSLATNSTITVGNTGTNPGRSYRLINADSTYTLTFKATGQTGVTLRPGQSATVAFNGTDYVFVGVVLGAAQTFTAAQTFRAANAIRSEAASTQDAVVIAGRAGGTSSYAVTLTPTTLSSSTTLTLPNATDTVAVLGTAQTFTAAQTFRAANAIRSEAASTQDAVVVAGRAGGTSSYAVTITPTTLSASRTVTLPNADINFTTGLGVANGGTGLTSGTSGGVLAFTATGTLASSTALAANAIVIGGGAGVAPATTTTGTGVVTAVGNAVNTTGGIVTQSGTLTANNFLLGGGSATAISSTSLLALSAAVTTGNFVKAAGYADTVTALGNTGTAINIDITNGGVFTATLTGNCTFTLRYPVSSGASSFILILTNDATANRTVAFSGGTFKYPNGSVTRTTTANAVDIWFFMTPNGGTTYYVSIPMVNLS